MTGNDEGNSVLELVDGAVALAAAAGVADLAAAMEGEGDEAMNLRAVCVRHEVAVGHRLAMIFAAAGNAALDAALVSASEGAADPAVARGAHLAAARLGGSVARVMGNVRLALLSLATLPAPASEQWVPVHFGGGPLCSPEEAARRLATAKAARAAARGEEIANDNEGEGASRIPTPAQVAQMAAAQAGAAGLAAEAGVAALAEAAGRWDDLKKFLCHEAAAAHRLVMRFGGRAADRLAAATPANDDDDGTDALRLASAAARLMARGRQCLTALPRLGPGPAGGPRRVAGYYWIGEKDMFARPAPASSPPESPAETSARASLHDDPASPDKLRPRENRRGRNKRPPPELVEGPPVAVQASSGEPRLRRGRLKNGNPSGDYLAAPRCGACTRAGAACRQPAMKNGRCRFHGGKSTGPRTADGLARSRAARRTHGAYSAEIIELRQAAAGHARRVRALLASVGASGARPLSVSSSVSCMTGARASAARPYTAPTVPAGHGVHSQNLRVGPPVTVASRAPSTAYARHRARS